MLPSIPHRLECVRSLLLPASVGAAAATADEDVDPLDAFMADNAVNQKKHAEAAAARIAEKPDR